jgi:hypothetical protein
MFGVLDGERDQGESGVGGWMGEWGWGMLVEIRRMQVVSSASVLLFFAMVGVAFG